MKVTLNTNITTSNNSVAKQNNPNFASRTPVFIFPEEIRLMPNWNGLIRKACNRVLEALNIATKAAPVNKHYQPSLWYEIANFAKNQKLGQPETFVSAKTPLFHQIHANSDSAEKTIAVELNRRCIKFAQVELD